MLEIKKSSPLDPRKKSVIKELKKGPPAAFYTHCDKNLKKKLNIYLEENEITKKAWFDQILREKFGN